MGSAIIHSSLDGLGDIAQTANASAAPGTDNMQLDTERQPGSAAIGKRALSPEQWVKFRQMLSLADQLRDAQPDSQSPGRKIKKTGTENETAGDHPSVKPPEADDQWLARRYVEMVIFERNPKPTQSDLARLTGISQPTWSRVFKRILFWQEVDKVYEALWAAYRVPQNTIERIMLERGVPAEQGIDGQDNTDRNTGPNVVEGKAIARLDRERYAKMDKKQMIRVILERKSTAITEKLVKLTASQLLKVIDRLEEGG